jgi:RNA polymerase sigma-70 factor, ECF subfamily
MNATSAPSGGQVADLALAQRISQGDCRAFEVLMRRYNRSLYRLARAALHDDAEAKDALQDAYLSAYKSIGQFRGDAALGTWLSRLVLNECGARRRRSARRDNIIPMVSMDSDAHMTSNVPDPGLAPDTAVTRLQVRKILEQKVGELPDALRVVFVMRSVEEMTVQETAQVLGVPEDTVRSRHFRARALLRDSLAQEVDLAERDIYEFGGEHCDAVVATVLRRVIPQP